MSVSASERALLLVVAGQSADVATTLYGLRRPDLYERNPLARFMFEQLGQLPGLVVGNLLALALLVVGVELGARTCRSMSLPEHQVQLLRVGSYATFAAVSFFAAAHNLRLLVTA